jgi:hypothetical protein
MEGIDCVVAVDSLGHTVNLGVERCRIVGEGFESRVLPTLHTAEIGSLVTAEKKIGLAVQSLNADMAVL